MILLLIPCAVIGYLALYEIVLLAGEVAWLWLMRMMDPFVARATREGPWTR